MMQNAAPSSSSAGPAGVPAANSASPGFPRTVAVLAGGPDAERPISLQTGHAIANALREVTVELASIVRDEVKTAELRWPHTGHPLRKRFARDKATADGGSSAASSSSTAPNTSPTAAGTAPAWEVTLHEIDRLTPAELAAIEADVIVPALHGPWGEGGPLQQLLEADQRPFVGCGSAAAALCMNKWSTKAIAVDVGVPTPAAVMVNRGGRTDDHASGDSRLNSDASGNVERSASTEVLPAETTAEVLIERLPLPFVIKPVDEGSSVGIHLCRVLPEVRDALEDPALVGRSLLAEQYVPGREFTVGIVADEVNSIVEVVPESGFFDYEAKYVSERTRFIVAPDLRAESAQRMTDAAAALYRACGCRDLGRIDFRLDSSGGIWMLELNTFPGFTAHSLVPMGAAFHGLPMPALCALLVQRAWARRR
ncbi:MAG: D-alanine--D-alanine ligase family protein [Planctomycetota bacterium]